MAKPCEDLSAVAGLYLVRSRMQAVTSSALWNSLDDVAEPIDARGDDILAEHGSTVAHRYLLEFWQ